VVDTPVWPEAGRDSVGALGTELVVKVWVEVNEPNVLDPPGSMAAAFQQ